MAKIQKDFNAYGVGQATYSVMTNPIVSERNPTANDKAPIGQLWVNTTSNAVYVLASVKNGVAVWGVWASPIIGDLIVGGHVTAGLGFISLAGGIDATGNSRFRNDVQVDGNIDVPMGDIEASNGSIYGYYIQTISDPTINISMYQNGIWAGGTNPDVDISFTTQGKGAVVVDCIPGGVLAAQWRTAQDYGQTNDATQTTLFSIPLAEGQMITLKAIVNGFRSDYLHALGGDITISAFRPTGGNVTQIGEKVISSAIDATATTGVACTADVHVGTQTVRVYVTGAVAEVWNWVSTYSYMYTTHP